jgi:hypothetical protein
MARAISATGAAMGSGAFVAVTRSMTLSSIRDFTSPSQWAMMDSSSGGQRQH